MLTNIQKLVQWFYTWTDLKIKIQQKETVFYFREKEVWWASLGANIGFEQNGKNQNYERPVLVFKKFSKEMFWCIPITSRIRTGSYYLNLVTAGVPSCLILPQLRLVSSKRLIRKMDFVGDEDFIKIQKAIKILIK